MVSRRIDVALLTLLCLLCNLVMSLTFIFFPATGGGTVVVICFTSFAPYFLKHRALAVGIMASGSGLGGVVLPPLVTYLFENFPFRDAMILYCKYDIRIVTVEFSLSDLNMVEIIINLIRHTYCLAMINQLIVLIFIFSFTWSLYSLLCLL